jgi:catalase (peroxidase I)
MSSNLNSGVSSYNPLDNNSLYPNNDNNGNNQGDFKENTKKFFSKAFNSFGGFLKDVSNKVKTNIEKINQKESETTQNEIETPINISNLGEGIKILENIETKYKNKFSSNDLITFHAIIDFYKNYEKKN